MSSRSNGPLSQPRGTDGMFSSVVWLLSLPTLPIRLFLSSALALLNAFTGALVFPLQALSAYVRQRQLYAEVHWLEVQLEGAAALNAALRHELLKLQAAQKQAQQRVSVLRQQRHGLMEVSLAGVQQVHQLRSRVELLEGKLAAAPSQATAKTRASTKRSEAHTMKAAAHVNGDHPQKQAEDPLAQVHAQAAKDYKALLNSALDASLVLLAGAAIQLMLLRGLRPGGASSSEAPSVSALGWLVLGCAVFNAIRFARLLHFRSPKVPVRKLYTSVTASVDPTSSHEPITWRHLLLPFRLDADGGLWLLVFSAVLLGALLPNCWMLSSPYLEAVMRALKIPAFR